MLISASCLLTMVTQVIRSDYTNMVCIIVFPIHWDEALTSFISTSHLSLKASITELVLISIIISCFEGSRKINIRKIIWMKLKSVCSSQLSFHVHNNENINFFSIKFCLQRFSIPVELNFIQVVSWERRPLMKIIKNWIIQNLKVKHNLRIHQNTPMQA